MEYSSLNYNSWAINSRSMKGLRILSQFSYFHTYIHSSHSHTQNNHIHTPSTLYTHYIDFLLFSITTFQSLHLFWRRRRRGVKPLLGIVLQTPTSNYTTMNPHTTEERSNRILEFSKDVFVICKWKIFINGK